MPLRHVRMRPQLRESDPEHAALHRIELRHGAIGRARDELVEGLLGGHDLLDQRPEILRVDAAVFLAVGELRDDLCDRVPAELALVQRLQDESTRTVASVLNDAQKQKMPLVTHPIVRTHPMTGRKALYAVSGSSFGIVGMRDDEARALLGELAAHATQPKYQLSLAYGVGDVVIWDNASLLHSATLVDPAHPRTLWRITIKEPTATGRARQVLAASFRGM